MLTICSEDKVYRLLNSFNDLEGSCIDRMLHLYTLKYSCRHELVHVKKLIMITLLIGMDGYDKIVRF